MKASTNYWLSASNYAVVNYFDSESVHQFVPYGDQTNQFLYWIRFPKMPNLSELK